MRVLAALDKFRGTATAAEATAAVGQAGWTLGVDVDEVPMSDGGEGILEVLGGANRTSLVTGPSGQPVQAGWRLQNRRAVIEMAAASGLLLAGGAERNDPLAATTRGTGELIAQAAEQGARTIVVGLGGSATTDGGLGAIEAMHSPARYKSIDLQVACDVRTRFVDAAAVFAPQKGATPAQVALLTARLNQLAERYLADYGVDVREVDGTGAAGGLAGGLLAMGGRIIGGFDVVADHFDLDERLESVDAVVTGEGYLDEQSLDGKVVGSLASLAVGAGRPVVAVVGAADDAAAARLVALGTADAPVTVVSLVQEFGEQRAFAEPQWCIEHAAEQALRALA
ncbi:glycerate kinase [Desertimonas flava]|jgi:glycerate kinase|uniref:glycerate kinase n=1 Tax=Desertimonas flava TaxID=2064846 RepID=UPI000E353E40|nr:glycerate kinase [Desertimonas flava]